MFRSGDEEWKCSECSIVFQNLPDLNDHKATHNKVERPFMCDFCPNAYQTAYKLKVFYAFELLHFIFIQNDVYLSA